ncbi:hypothetical protein CRUP_003315, partial [Coryphaenoides rupestris]
KRKRRSDIVVVRGRLRLYSASGFFLLLGLVVLAMGIGMATLGYWPHSVNTQSFKSEPAEAGGGGGDGGDIGGSTSKASPGKQPQTTDTGDKVSAAGAVGRGRMAVVIDGERQGEETNSSANSLARGKISRPAGGGSGGMLTRFLEQHRHSERMK